MSLRPQPDVTLRRGTTTLKLFAAHVLLSLLGGCGQPLELVEAVPVPLANLETASRGSSVWISMTADLDRDAEGRVMLVEPNVPDSRAPHVVTTQLAEFALSDWEHCFGRRVKVYGHYDQKVNVLSVDRMVLEGISDPVERASTACVLELQR